MTHIPPSPSLRRADAVVIGAYLLALAVAALAGSFLPGRHPIVVAAAADLAATAVIFGFSVALDNSSMYDPYWSVAPLPIAVYYAAQAGSLGSGRMLAIMAVLLAWGVRLTWNWRRGWTGLGHEDWRYVDLREKTGRGYWLVSALGLHLFPTVQVFLGCVPLYYAASVDAPFGPGDLLGPLVAGAGLVIQGIADEQLRAFRREGRPGEMLATGLWAYSRHPNYFGEILIWWGVFLTGIAARPDVRWQIAGAAAITIMFLFASIPMMDKRMLARRPAYAERMRRVSGLLPWWPRKQ